MVYLKINDLSINQYTVNLTIQNNQVIGVFSRDKNITKKFLDIVSGINKNNGTCFHEENDIYDNKEYFKDRLYFDFEKKYLSTLKVNLLEERFSHKYGLKFNKEKFVKISKELDVRGETEITYVYKFTKSGNTFVNYALLSSLEKPNIIVNNPTTGLTLESDIKYIVEGLTSKQYNTVLLGLDSISRFKKKVDKVLLFTDFNDAIVLDIKESLIVFYDNSLELNNKIYQGDYIITLNNYSKEDLRNFMKSNIEYKVISLSEIQDYLKVKNE